MTNIQIFWLIIAVLWTVCEVFIARSATKKTAVHTIRGTSSEYLIWIVITLSLIVALKLKTLPWLTFTCSEQTRLGLSVAMVLMGLTLRIYAISNLGRFFSTRVTISLDHQLIRQGAYRYVRHPAYSGLLLSFAGVGIAMGNLLSLLSLFVPLAWILLLRIKYEEQLLLQHFGSDYQHYCQHSKKLIPWLY